MSLAPGARLCRESVNSSTLCSILYTLFFHWIEPIATAVGAYYAFFRQNDYMEMTVPGVLGVSTRESIVLTQLANLYFVFALNEALVLRVTNDRRVWSTFLLGLLIADFGHLFSVNAVGLEVYYEFWKWNSMYWGNLGMLCYVERDPFVHLQLIYISCRLRLYWCVNADCIPARYRPSRSRFQS